MQTQYENAGDELHAKIEQYMDKVGCSYAEAMRRVTRDHRDLAVRYAFGEGEINPKDAEGAEEFQRRCQAYEEHFRVDKSTAEKMVLEHDPEMRKYSKQGGSTVMSTEQVPLSAESVVDVRAQERMNKGGVKDYAEAMKAVLDADPLLAECYLKGLPYLEASAHAYQQDEQTTGPTAKAKLGVLISGARLSSNAPDVPLMLRIANMTPDLVRDAAGERLDEIANKLIDTLGLRGMKADRYPETLRQARREHPALVTASETGRMTEEALREIFYPWFSRD